MSDPTKRGREVYDKAVALSATGSFVAALAGPGVEVSHEERPEPALRHLLSGAPRPGPGPGILSDVLRVRRQA